MAVFRWRHFAGEIILLSFAHYIVFVCNPGHTMKSLLLALHLMSQGKGLEQVVGRMPKSSCCSRRGILLSALVALSPQDFRDIPMYNAPPASDSAPPPFPPHSHRRTNASSFRHRS